MLLIVIGYYHILYDLQKRDIEVCRCLWPATELSTTNMYHAGQEIWVSGSIWDDHPYSFNTSLRIVLRVTAYSTWACLQDVRDTNSARKALTCLKCKSWVAICGDSVRVKRCKEKKGNLKVMLHCGRSQGKLHKKKETQRCQCCYFWRFFCYRSFASIIFRHARLFFTGIWFQCMKTFLQTWIV